MSFALIVIMTFACCGCNHFKILILLLSNRICPDLFLGWWRVFSPYIPYNRKYFKPYQLVDSNL